MEKNKKIDTYKSDDIKNFWNNYYSNKKSTFTNSPFSKFVKPYLNENSSIIDLGCGDGRDAIYFAKNKIYTHGVDMSKKAIEINKKYENKFLKFTLLDLKDLKSIHDIYDFAYCRFLFHSINEKIEDNILIWMSNNIKNQIFIETRISDEKLINAELNHYRRFFKEEDFKNKLNSLGFEIIYSKASKNFSRYKKIYNATDLKHDPLLLRMIISK